MKMKTMLHLLIVLTLLLPQHQARNSTGLTIELIQPYSHESPFYLKNFTRMENMKRLVYHSVSRANFLSSQKTYKSKNNLTQILQVRPEIHMAWPGPTTSLKIGIGTFNTEVPYKSYYLIMDTASELIWLQCKACITYNRCFPQLGPPFPNWHSKSYKSLRCNRHSLCFPGQCLGAFCSYHATYDDGLESIGYLATETFTFNSASGQTEIVPHLVFGCGISNKLVIPTVKPAGILGLGWGPRSFISQQNYDKFSYCLNHYSLISQGAHSYLRFGNDIVEEEGFKATVLRQVRDTNNYYLDLEGISVNGIRLHISESTFAINDDGTGGTIIDTGTAFTFLVKEAYNIVREAIETHFRNLQNYRKVRIEPFDLCYERLMPRQDPLPSITLHFSGADLVLGPEYVYYVKRRLVCFLMMPDEMLTIYGAGQQSNIRFIYDRRRKMLLFKPENCLQNP